MAASTPATSHAQVRGVRRFADEDFACGHPRALHLRVAFQTKIIVALEEQFGID